MENTQIKGDTLIEVNKYFSISVYTNEGQIAFITDAVFNGTLAENNATLLNIIKPFIAEGSRESNVIFENFENKHFDMWELGNELDKDNIGLNRVDHDDPYTDENHQWLQKDHKCTFETHPWSDSWLEG